MNRDLDHYLPEFDEDGARAKLEGASNEELKDLLIEGYKEKRVWAKMLDVEISKLDRIQAIIAEQSALLGMPRIPNDDDLRRMTDSEE